MFKLFKSNKSTKLKGKKGFSLVEVVAAMAIFAITSSMLVGSVYTAVKIASLAKAKSGSSINATSALEKFYITHEKDSKNPEDGSDNEFTSTNNVQLTFTIK